ncbi:MAG: chorismate synthase [Oscillospiraceae bacterium]|nr:chorismate synthase [Oscillospiraceae bacterium]
MASMFGKSLKVQIFGQSHSAAIGVVMDGLPAGTLIDLDELRAFMKRRAPGQSDTATPRKEADEIEILSGVVPGEGGAEQACTCDVKHASACGAPLAMVIRNTNTRSGDYAELRDVPRPSHADYAAYVKYGTAHDIAGGGHFSGRLTAPLCAAGGVCVQILRTHGVTVRSEIVQIGTTTDPERFRAEILAAKADGDSVGGIIECTVNGVRAGLGEPMFEGMENRIAAAIFGIPAIKGIEFGNGFACASLRGSQNNDEFIMQNGIVTTATNNAGGILGGITSGLPIVFRVAVKPTPSIAKEQRSVSLSRGENTALSVRGRHDPCIVPRAAVCVEAAAAIAVYDVVRGE